VTVNEQKKGRKEEEEIWNKAKAKPVFNIYQYVNPDGL
jgi:hypothetical protein